MAALIGWSILKIVIIIFVFAMSLAGVLTWVERKMSALIQDRVGPNWARIGNLRLAGLFHVIADSVKMLTKEDFEPGIANHFLFKLGPWLAVVPSLLLFVVIPFGPTEHFVISNVEVGVLVIFAIGSLGVYGTSIGAWASNNNYAMLGSIRTANQMLSYEVVMGLSLVGVFMCYESTNLQEIINEQGELLWGFLPKWGIFMQPLAFVLFLAASIAETKRAPFDLPEGESEIVGYFIEYSSMRFGLYMLAEFVGIVAIAALAAALFLGGWQIPGVPTWHAGEPWWLTGLRVVSMVVKTIVLIYVQMLIRWTVPRFRYDQLMRLGWQYMLPLSLVNILATGLVLMAVA